MGVTHSTVMKKDLFSQLKADMTAMSESYVKAGWPSGEKVRAPTKKGSGAKPFENMSEVARVAVWNEFGAKIKHAGGTAYRTTASLIGSGMKTRFISNKNADAYDKRTGAHDIVIPARPAFRNFLDSSREKAVQFMAKLMGEVQSGNMKPDAVFAALGLWAQAGIRKSIRALREPENAKSTIRRKHSSHPLIDNGQEINSVTFVTVKGRPEKEMAAQVI